MPAESPYPTTGQPTVRDVLEAAVERRYAPPAAPGTPREMETLDTVTRRVNDALDALHDLISELTARLDPVCYPAVERRGEPGPADDTQAHSPLAGTWLSHEQAVHDAARRLRDLLDRLDLAR